MNRIEYYTDGACSGNPGTGGFAVVELLGNSMMTYYSKKVEETTNNRMELSAMIHALKTILLFKDSPCTVYSDSAYVVNICNDWIWKWADNNWKRAKGKPIENPDLIAELYSLLMELKENNIDFEIKKCDGHAGVLGNELADALAANNMAKFERLTKEYNIKDYITEISYWGLR